MARENGEGVAVRLYNGGVAVFMGLQTTLPSSRATKRGANGEGNTAKTSPLFASYRHGENMATGSKERLMVTMAGKRAAR